MTGCSIGFASQQIALYPRTDDSLSASFTVPIVREEWRTKQAASCAGTKDGKLATGKRPPSNKSCDHSRRSRCIRCGRG